MRRSDQWWAQVKTGEPGGGSIKFAVSVERRAHIRTFKITLKLIISLASPIPARCVKKCSGQDTVWEITCLTFMNNDFDLIFFIPRNRLCCHVCSGSECLVSGPEFHWGSIIKDVHFQTYSLIYIRKIPLVLKLVSLILMMIGIQHLCKCLKFWAETFPWSSNLSDSYWWLLTIIESCLSTFKLAKALKFNARETPLGTRWIVD